jgi:hypothetical protein
MTATDCLPTPDLRGFRAPLTPAHGNDLNDFMFVNLDYANTSVVGNSEFHWESQKTTLKSCAYAQLLRKWLGIVNPSFIK